MKNGTTITFGVCGHFVPLGDERLLLHVGVEHGGIARAGGGDEVRLVADGLGGVLVQAGAVAGDDERGLGGIDAGSDLAGAAEDQIGHERMDADRQAVVEGFSADHAWSGR